MSSPLRRPWPRCPFALALLLVACGGAASPGADALNMANWIHRDDGKWAYFVPNANWTGAEHLTGITIGSPTGDAIVEFDFAYGPIVPSTVDAVEAIVWQSFANNYTIVTQSPTTLGPLGGNHRVTEFTATNNTIHGILTADVGFQMMSAYVIDSSAGTWAQSGPVLQLIRDHLTYYGTVFNGSHP